MEFTIITNKSLSARIRGYIKSAEKRREEYWNVLFNCVERSFEHNDVSWVNKGLQAAKAVGRYRATVSVLKQVVPFAFDAEAQIFHGKRKAGMYNKLAENYSDVLNTLVAEQLEADTAPPSKSKKDWNYDKALANFLKACQKHDITLHDVVVDLEKMEKQAA